MKDKLTKKEVKTMITGKLSRYFGVSPEEASAEQMYKAVVMCIRDMMLEKRERFHQEVKAGRKKRVYYLCMEFLLGRSLKNSVYNLDVKKAFESALADYNYTLNDLYEMEPDAGLGNGGLGRLAACFMDALATGDYPAMGYSIRYDYGLFKQKIVDGWQTELPDLWLPGGEVWLTQRQDKRFIVRFDGRVEEEWTDGGLKIHQVDCKEVEAIPYDMMISGADSKAVSVLRLWHARNRSSFDMKSFSEGDYMRAMQDDNEAELLSKVLYPSDNHSEGKSLRLKQQYFLVSASIQNIFADHKHRYGSLDTLPDLAAIHINDTHPALCIPEMMRLLMDENGYSWEKAWDIVVRTVAYTNHTVMSEALETWSEDLIERRLPRIYSIIKEINQRFSADMWHLYPGDWDKIERMSILSHGMVRMANLSVIGSHSINGVSALHTDIIKNSIFKDFNDVFPERFTNVTNGIAHRRWLYQSNPRLSALLDETIGHGWYLNAEKLSDFHAFENDASVLERLNIIKELNKEDFVSFAEKQKGIKGIDPKSVFDVQAKRLHEYKRQLMNALRIIAVYNDLKDNPDLDILPKTYIFGAKAASGYFMAKRIIKLLWCLSEEIKKQPKIREKLNVVYMEDYCVTMAETLMPATEISEQISQAGKEASGTGNMKFMINGALTVGTLDGANVEMQQAVGKDNIYIFGMTAEEVTNLWNSGYSSSRFLQNNPRLKRAVESLSHGFNGESFQDIANYLLTASPIADPYMCLADFDAYDEMQNRISKEYLDRTLWAKKSLRNIASSGIFAADRAIKEYADRIWHLESLKDKE